jgi:hypothetical protein
MPVAFISYAHADQAVVEPYAVAAADEIGRANVFYDSWSVQPGDGIVNEMNDALERCTHFFLFMTASSLTSEMVKLEWQAGLFRRAAGDVRLIPVRLDGSTPPGLLLQLRYIDAFAHGEAAAVNDLRQVLRGAEVFAPAPPIENLTAVVSRHGDGSAEIRIDVRTYMEPNPSFGIFVNGEAASIKVNAPSEYVVGHTHGGGVAPDGAELNTVIVDKQSPLVPGRPLIIELRRDPPGPVEVHAIAIERTRGYSPANLGRAQSIPIKFV